MNRVAAHLSPLVALAAAAACASSPSPTGRQPAFATIRSALESITAADILKHIQVLASDRFEGRGPGTPGEDSTVAYLTSEFRRMGLEPGSPDGSYIQNVPLAGITTQSTASIDIAGRAVALEFPASYVGVSRRGVPEVNIEGSDIVFVGYGVVAPEYGWDDYKGLDVRGKTIVMLINDPAVPDPANPAQLDTALFRGRAMTYYGRWTYKYEIASEKGAAAALIVHETGPAGYPWEVVTGSWGRENFDIQSQDRNMGRVPIEAWISTDKAKELFAAAGQDFEQLKRAAAGKDFRPMPLNGKLTVRARNTIREIQSRNVVARLSGASRPDEFVVYTAHWDHFGRNPSLTGDQIFNGAADNASGTAGLLELAEAFTKLERKPARSVLFLAVTAEEFGLLGAKHYATSPLYPLAKTAADINIDVLNLWGRTRDVVVVGRGNTTLEDLLIEEAGSQGRTVVPDPEPEKGFFYRSDHFEFAKQGVPALYTDEGTDYIGKPPGYGDQKRAEYTANDYHKPSDEVKPDWDLSGAEQDVRLMFRVGHRVVDSEVWPEWQPGTEFRARREEMLKRGSD